MKCTAIRLLLLLAIAGCAQRNAEPVPPVDDTRANPAPAAANNALAPPPHVLLISLDTLRPDHLGAAGYDRPTSPALDRFAAQSIRFANCRAQATWTLPSHMSLLTSMLPSHNGVDNLNKVLPAEIPTLPELLQQAGWRTTGLVNNGQMRAHWGFARGFDDWQEFAVDAPEGDCEAITAAALRKIASWQSDRPEFLFLHYYDAHDAYDAPVEFRRRLGTTLSGMEARAICQHHRYPGAEIDDPALLRNLVAAYDAEIARLDASLGKLLSAVPEDALVVFFSDHGEAFEEHGWLLHGASLYEEEVRALLMMRLAGGAHGGRVVDDSTMLLDAGPTILACCGLHPPGTFQGTNLLPAITGKPLAPRLVPAESKAVLEGRVSYSVTLYPLKGIYSLIDGQRTLYRLPDEQRPLDLQQNALAAAALFDPLAAWVRSEQYWLLHAAGGGELETTIQLDRGRFGLYVPIGLDPERDQFEVAADGRHLRWRVHPGGERNVRSLLLVPSLGDAALTCDFHHNGEQLPAEVYLGPLATSPEQLPVNVAASIAADDPFITAPFSAERPGLFVRRHRTAGSIATPGEVKSLNAETIRQLRTLGYLD